MCPRLDNVKDMIEPFNAVGGNGDNHIPLDNRQLQDSRWIHNNNIHTMELRVMILTTEVVVVYTVMNRVTTVPSVGINVQ